MAMCAHALLSVLKAGEQDISYTAQITTWTGQSGAKPDWQGEKTE